MSRRWRWPEARRGAFLQVPPASVAAPPAARAPEFARQSALPAPVARRGRFAWVAPQASAATTGPLIPAPLSRDRVGGLPVRRGRFQSQPLTGAAPPPPAPPSEFTRADRRWPPFVRRGEFWWTAAAPVSPAVTPTLPEFARQAGIVKPGALRHGRFLYTPATPPGPVPRWSTARRPSAPGARRGDIWTAPPAPPAPGRVPDWRTRRRVMPVGVARSSGWVLAGGVAIVILPDANPITLTIRDRGHTATVQSIGSTATTRTPPAHTTVTTALNATATSRTLTAHATVQENR